MSDAGGYLLSHSSYGTSDQGGNAEEWNETLIRGLFRGDRGGHWNSESNSLMAQYWAGNPPVNESGATGFRVANIPEPRAAVLLFVGTVATILNSCRKPASCGHG